MGELRNIVNNLENRILGIEKQLKVLGENNFLPKVEKPKEVDDVKYYYAVIKGRKTGIFTKWYGKGGVDEVVKGIPDAYHKKFKTREKANEFLKDNLM